MARTQAHTRYYVTENDKKVRVPGTTTILGILAKPALIPWANRLGLAGIDVQKYVDDKADIGTCAHYLIECEAKGQKADLNDFSPNVVKQAENSYIKWLDWSKQVDLKVGASEVQYVSNVYRYGGTIDILGWVNGIYSLVDIKTSGSGIWPEMRHQVGAYYNLCEENEQQVEQAFIVRVGRDEEEGFEVAKVGSLEGHFALFLHCLEIYKLQKTLKA